MNNSANFLLLKNFTRSLFIALIFISTSAIYAQSPSFQKGTKYTIEEITVTGNTSFGEQTIVSFSRLNKGDVVTIPGPDEKISSAISRLWESGLFSSIDIYLARTEGDKAFLEINLIDLPELNEVTIQGVKKNKKEELDLKISEFQVKTKWLPYWISAISLLISLLALYKSFDSSNAKMEKTNAEYKVEDRQVKQQDLAN